MSIILGALGGIGDAGLQLTRDNAKQWHDEDMAKMQSDLAQQKAEALARFQVNLAAEPAKRLQAKAQEMAKEQVPVEPASVTEISGNDPTNVGDKEWQDGKGLSGMSRAQVAAYHDPNMLAQYDRQLAADKQAAIDAVAGKTRPRTNDEALSAAVADAKINDIPAYVVGKGIIADKFMKIGDGDRLVDTTTGKVAVDANLSKEDRKDARAQAHEDALNERQQNALDSLEKRAQDKIDAISDKMEKSNPQAFHVMNSFDNDIKSAQGEIRANNVLLSNIGSKDPRQKVIADNNAELASQIAATKATKWAYAKSIGINIPDALIKPDQEPTPTPKAAPVKRFTYDPATGTVK